ncbi:MAG: FtsQ-type POTRA domain-containing protein [Calditrichaeota bacterium]|nr:FtsQ-type POTRA domain-containing protein [Calditrichota bacterium]MCB9391057.1 FtsQ-type POTRA domain-containing protein [Calditrichota bacterium]
MILLAVSGRFLKRGLLQLVEQTSEWQCSEIRVQTGPEVSREEVLALAACEPGSTLGLYSTEVLRTRLLQHPWIKDAAVRRLPPDALQIVISERMCIGILRDFPDLGVTEDMQIVPCEGKPWINSKTWISLDGVYVHAPGMIPQFDPLYSVVRSLKQIRLSAPELSQNVAEIYRMNDKWGAVLVDPLLTISYLQSTEAASWSALNNLIEDTRFRERIDSNSVIDLTVSGFVTLQVPNARAEDSRHS